jgi:hypothetical protein
LNNTESQEIAILMRWQIVALLMAPASSAI